MSRETKAKVNITLRVPESLRSRLEAAAEKNDGSINTEINRRLERSFQNESSFVEQFGSNRRFIVAALSEEAGETTSIDARDLLQALGTVIRHVDRLLAANPVALAIVNGEPQYGLDEALQVSAGVIAVLQAVNGIEAGRILEEASSVVERDPLIWREAAIAATAQALGLTLADATTRVDLGATPPKAGMARLQP